MKFDIAVTETPGLLVITEPTASIDLTTVHWFYGGTMASGFEHQTRHLQEFTVVINPALGAKSHKRTFSASTQEEANLKAKRLAQEIFDAECKIQFVE